MKYIVLFFYLCCLFNCRFFDCIFLIQMDDSVCLLFFSVELHLASNRFLKSPFCRVFFLLIFMFVKFIDVAFVTYINMSHYLVVVLYHCCFFLLCF